MVVANRLFEAVNSVENNDYDMSEMTFTENGAVTYKNTGTALLDMFSQLGAMRNRSDKDIVSKFNAAYKEAGPLAIICAFYLRDVRGGQGERKIFSLILKALAKDNAATDFVHQLIPFIPEYGRWDDLFAFLGTKYSAMVMRFYAEQLLDDARKLRQAKKESKNVSISLAAKWAGSQSGGKKGKVRFEAIRKASGLSSVQLRKLLSALRQHLNVVERQMCFQNWKEIDYAAVPSRAMKIYRHAFSKHDPQGFSNYIAQVEAGKAKINSGTLYPYELVEKARHTTDKVIEAQWKALPDYVGDHLDNAIAVCDVSGSMYGSPMDVSVSIGIYLAERNKGKLWKNRIITFSETPRFLELNPKHSLHQKIKHIESDGVGYNTNFLAVFKLILDVAKTNKLSQDDLPKVVYAISDMEFDSADRNASTNYDRIRDMYKEAGYEMPTLVFWNVDARNDQSPVKFDTNGVALFSGLSPSIFTSVLSGKVITPADVMIERLTSDRYKPLLEAFDLISE